MTEPPHRRGQDHDGLLHRPAIDDEADDFTREDVAMLHRLGPILQAFARQNPGDPLWDDAHAAFYDVGRLAAKIEALLPPA